MSIAAVQERDPDCEGLLKIISGGQTGVDRAALDLAMQEGLPVGGWCPHGRRAEDGQIPDLYPLWETRSSEYHVRTQRNVETSTATLIITRGTPTGGTRFTAEIAGSMRRPLLIIDVGRMDDDDAVTEIVGWLGDIRPSILNVAGPRESGSPGIERTTKRILGAALRDAGYI